MKIKELQKQLIEAYSQKNLNNISLTLINLYKNKQFSKLQKIAEIISDFIAVEINNEGKGFSKLMMLYHPDRARFFINEINLLTEKNDFDGLIKHTHILKLESIEEITKNLDNYEDIDYSPVYDWDLNMEGYSIISDFDKVKEVRTKTITYDFYDAVKIRQYGDTDIEFPPYYLEDIDEFELSSAHISDLDGIQFCLHAKNIDLSDNQITDLSLLAGLSYLEELNISDNRISILDPLSNLMKLKKLFLSDNMVDDISALFELNRLEYVNLSGNNVSQKQIDVLIETGVIVEY